MCSLCRRHSHRTNVLRELTFTIVVVTLLVGAQGCGDKSSGPPDDQPNEKLAFLTGIGSQWTYRYTYSNGIHPPNPGVLDNISGSRAWQVQSVATLHDSTICVVVVSGVDTVRQREYSGGRIIHDTSFVKVVASQFVTVIRGDSIFTNWMSTVVFSQSIPSGIVRSIQAAGDTVRIVGTGFDTSSAWYVQGVGLVRYQASHTSPMAGFAEELVLVSNALK